MSWRTIIGLAMVGLIGIYVVVESWCIRATEDDHEEPRRNQMLEEGEE